MNGGRATSAGRPAARRAVGRANGDNRLAIIVPCHRVIGNDGTLCGCGGGLYRKQWLLDHESRRYLSAKSTPSGRRLAGSTAKMRADPML